MITNSEESEIVGWLANLAGHKQVTLMIGLIIEVSNACEIVTCYVFIISDV